MSSYRDYRRQSRSPSDDRRKRDRNSYERSRHRRSRSKSLDKHKRRRDRRSESKSPDRQAYRQKSERNQRNERNEKIEKTQQQIREENEQKIRLAFRNGTFDVDTQTQRLSSSLPRERIQILYEQAVRPSLCNQPVLVRELYISGLPELSEGLIHSIMAGYGAIEAIEICKNFAFVKFFKVEDASNACADYHNINIRLHHSQNAGFKMFFADHLKRWNVVSNNIQYEIKEHLIPVLYVSVKNDPKYANEEYLLSLFSKYGYVKGLSLKQNDTPGPKVFALVEYETIQMAIRGRDRLQQAKEKLGDRRSEVTMLLDHNKVIRSYPNVANQLKYQKSIRPSNISKLPPTIPESHISNVNMGSTPFEADPAVFDFLVKMAEEQNNQSEVDWSGYFTRNNKLKVAVDLRLETKRQIDFKEHHLNISHRAHLQPHVWSDYPLAIGRFKASNGSNSSLFQDYIKYFQERQRAGIIQTMRYLIYLIPAGVGPNHQYRIEKDELLALFFNPLMP